MISVRCFACQKTFALNPATAPRSVVECYSDSAGQKVTYHAACPHCGKPNSVTRVEK